MAQFTYSWETWLCSCSPLFLKKVFLWKPRPQNWRIACSLATSQLKTLAKIPEKDQSPFLMCLGRNIFQRIVPSITYCIAMWGSCSPSTFYILEHLHLKATKLVHKLTTETPDTDVLDLVKWKPLVYIYKRRLASIMYQIYHNSVPD